MGLVVPMAHGEEKPNPNPKAERAADRGPSGSGVAVSISPDV